MIKQIAIALLGVITLGLGACTSVVGNFNGLGSDPMSMAFVHKNGDYGPMTGSQYKTVVEHANACLRDIHQQTASLGEVMVTNAAADAAGGYLGGSVGYKTEADMLKANIKSVAPRAIGTFSAIANSAQGAINGAKIKSAVVSNLVGNCVNGDIHDPITARTMGGMHVYGSSIRTNNSSHQLPAFIKKVSTETQPGDTHEPEQQ